MFSAFFATYAVLVGETAGGPSGAELFDLRKDPGERHDLAAQNPEQVAELQRQLRDWIASVPAVTPTANAHFDPQRSFSETKEKQPWNKAAE